MTTVSPRTTSPCARCRPRPWVFSMAPWRSGKAVAGARQLPIPGRGGVDPYGRRRSVQCRAHRPGRMPALVWVDSDDHDRASLPSVKRRPRSTCRLREPAGVMPLPSRTVAGHRPDLREHTAAFLAEGAASINPVLLHHILGRNRSALRLPPAGAEEPVEEPGSCGIRPPPFPPRDSWPAR